MLEQINCISCLQWEILRQFTNVTVKSVPSNGKNRQLGRHLRLELYEAPNIVMFFDETNLLTACGLHTNCQQRCTLKKTTKDYKPLGVLLRPVLRRSWHALLLWRRPSQLEELVSEVCRPAANAGITSFNGSETVHFCFRNWVRPNTAVYFIYFLYTLQPQLFFLFIL